jgi:dienelactone hydrolase
MKNLWVASILMLLFTTASFAERKDVTFNAPDGFALKGTFYSPDKVGPGLLLLHQCNADHQIYDHLATMLSAAGYSSLAFDFRQIPEKMPADVNAALNFLASQSTVNKVALGVVAGSCGVNQGIQAARRHPEIKALVLLSGGTDAEGEAWIKSSRVPVLGAASEEDTDAAASIKKLVGLSTNTDSQLEMFKGAGHAASMFEKQPELEADIVIFFRSNLPIGGYGLKPALK